MLEELNQYLNGTWWGPMLPSLVLILWAITVPFTFNNKFYNRYIKWYFELFQEKKSTSTEE